MWIDDDIDLLEHQITKIICPYCECHIKNEFDYFDNEDILKCKTKEIECPHCERKLFVEVNINIFFNVMHEE